MKLTIFTPAKKTSAIGRCSALLSKKLLSYGHEITIVRTEAEEMLDSDTHLFDTLILAWTQTKKIMTLIQNADAIIYQVGDNHEFHKGALAWLEKIPGIVILHDFF